MFLLKHSTASQVIPLGIYLDSTDGDTAETGLTIANTDLQVWKTGATSLVNKNSGGATHMSIGVYQSTLDATDTNTLGPIKIYSHVSGALVVVFEGLIVPVITYDAMITNGLNNLGGVAQTADNDAILQTLPIATDLVSNGAINTLSGAVVNVDLVDTTTTNSDMRGTDSANTVVPPTVSEFNARTLTSTSYATASNLTQVDTVVDAIKVKTDQMAFTVTNQLDSNMLTHTALIPANYITSTGIAANALNGKGDWNTVTPPTSLQIWTEATRELTSGNNIVLAKGVGLTGLNDITGSQVMASGDIDGFSLEEASKLILAGAAGKTSGMETTSATIRAADDSKTRITATVDPDGNRSSVILDVTG